MKDKATPHTTKDKAKHLKRISILILPMPCTAIIK